MTLTANRIEWNGRQGILLADDSSFLQITGNYLDRNSLAGIVAIHAAGETGRCEHITLTGNFFYRNGATAPKNSADSSHLSWKERVALLVSVIRSTPDDPILMIRDNTAHLMEFIIEI